MRVSSTVMRPPAASANCRDSVAVPDSRCRKFRATRSAVSRPAARPAKLAPPPCPARTSRRPHAAGRSTRADRAGETLPRATSRPGDHAARLGHQHRLRALRRIDRGGGGHVARRRCPRRAPPGPCPDSPRAPAAPGSGAASLTPGAPLRWARPPRTRPARLGDGCRTGSSRTCAAAWKSRIGGPQRLRARCGSTARAITAFTGRFSSALIRRTSASAACVPIQHGRPTARPRRRWPRPPRRASARRAVHRPRLPPRPDLFGHERQVRREQPQHRGQAPPAWRCWRWPRPRDRSRRSGATSPAPGSRRRRLQKNASTRSSTRA